MVRPGGPGPSQQPHHPAGGPGAPPKKKPKPVDPVRDRPQDPGHGTPPSSGGGGGGRTNPAPTRDFPGDTGHGTNPSRGSRYSAPPAWVVRRQEVLRRAGYNVSIDGVWGPASQRAWARFTQGVNSATRKIAFASGGIPPGYAIYKGRLLTKLAVTAARAIDHANVNAAVANARREFNTIRATHAQASGLVAAAPAPRQGANIRYLEHHLRTPQQREAEQRRQTLVAVGKAQVSQAQWLNDERLFGPDGLKVWAANRHQAQRDIANRATPNDILSLIHRGLLDVTNKGDVAAIQHAVGAKVDGVFGPDTARTLERKYGEQRAADIRRGVAVIKKAYFSNGIAQAAAMTVLGHAITPERFFAMMQAGGPKARRLIVRAQELEGWSSIPLDQFRQQKAQLAYLQKHGHYHEGPLSDAEQRALLPKQPWLWNATNIQDLQVRMNVELDTRRMERQLAAAHSDESWYASVWDDVSSAMGWTAHTTAVGINAVHIFIYRNTYAAGSWLNDITDDNLSWISHNGFWTYSGAAARGLIGGDFALGVSRPDARRQWQGVGFVDPTTAWRRGEITYDQWSAANPWAAVAYESVIDPLNFVGGIGIADKAWRGAEALRVISARLSDAGAAERASASIALANKLAVPSWLDTGGDVLETLAVARDRLALGVNLTPIGRAWKHVTVARSVAIERAQHAVDGLIARGVGDFEADAKRLAIAHNTLLEGGAASAVDAARLTAAKQAGGDALDQVDDLTQIADMEGIAQGAIPDELATTMQQSIDVQVAAIEQLAPNVVEWLGGLRTSMYRTFRRRGGKLSQTGRMVAAMLTEMEARRLIHYYAEQLADGDAETLQNILGAPGTAYAGHLHPDLIEPVGLALDEFRTLLYDQVIPRLDDISRRSVAAHAWDAEERLYVQMSAETKAAIEKEMGFTFDELVNESRFVRVKNPNWKRALSLDMAERMLGSEIKRRQGRLVDWAESRKFAARNSADAIERIDKTVIRRRAEIEAEVDAAYVPNPDAPGTIIDQREFLHVPPPYAREGAPIVLNAAGVDVGGGFQAADTIVKAELENLLDSMSQSALDINDVGARTAMVGAAQRAQQLHIEEGWQDFAKQLSKHRVDQASARGFYTPSVYRQQSMYLEALGASQRAYCRVVYRTLTFGLQQWKTATLPFHAFAYTIRNTIDNYAKMMLDGFIDIRRIFNPDGRSLLEMQFRPMHLAARVMDGMFGTNVADQLTLLQHHFWAQHGDVLDKILGAHGIPIPSDLKTGQMSFYRNLVQEVKNPADLILHRPPPREPRVKAFAWIVDNVWDLLGTRPENFAKRSVYVQSYAKVLRNGGTELEAATQAMKDVDRVLFDYSKVTVLESQIRVLWPFVLFWRKNATFWAGAVTRHPWFLPDAQRVYDAHAETNGDEPDWMQRYLNVGIFGGALRALGADWLADWAKDAYADPLQYSSVSAFYRAFKQANPNLPADQKGSWGFITAISDATTDIGLGMNPFLRTIGEDFGVFNRRSWITIYPGTNLLQSLSESSFLYDRFGPGGSLTHIWGYNENGFNLEQAIQDPVLAELGQTQWQTLTTSSFNRYVNQEIASQVAHGRPADRAAAEEKIRSWFAIQGIVAFVGGLYTRHITDTDIQFYTLQQRLRETDGSYDIWKHLTPAQQEAYKLEAKTLDPDNAARLRNPQWFDNYRAAIEGARTFFQIDDWDERQAYLKENPDIIGIIDPIVGGRIPDSETWMQQQQLILQTDRVSQLYYDIFGNPEFAADVRSAAYADLVTPRLKAFWAQNDTPFQRRQRAVKGAYAGYVHRSQDTYFAIPESDYDARTQYLEKHPELTLYWDSYNSISDDYRGILSAANSTFRDVYFKIVDTGDWDAADAYLKAHPFIFDFTSAEGRVSPDGRWAPRSAAQAAYAKIRPDLLALYSLPKGEQQAYIDAHPVLQAYFEKWDAKGSSIWEQLHGRGAYSPGGLSQHARDYLAVKPLLDAFFNLPDSAKDAFLDAHPEVRAYFAKYAHERGMSGSHGTSQHALDYLAIKPVLDAFFALPDGKRFDYLAKHPELQRYFDKYGKHSTGPAGGAFQAAAADPEIHARYTFWMRYFALPPDERPAFVHRHAEEAGIYIYGSLSYDQQQRKEARWRREAIALGQSPRAIAYAHIKPLLDIFFSLKGAGQRTLFIQMNPELGYYFDHYSKHTGIPEDVLPLLTEYFQKQPYSDERRQYLDEHPALQRFFNKDDTPHDKAIQRMVEAYFSLPSFSHARDEYLASHPELGIWFDQKQAQHDRFSKAALAFNQGDPRMAPFTARYADIIPMDALKQFELAWQAAKEAYLTDQARERTPEKAKTGSPKKAGTLTSRRDRSPS